MAVNDNQAQSTDSQSTGGSGAGASPIVAEEGSSREGAPRLACRLSRRNVLALGGAAGLAGLAGCMEMVDGLLNRAASEAVTTTRATPASVYGGTDASGADERSARNPVVATDLTYVPFSVSAEVSGRSVSVDLDGWFVDATVQAQNHNSSRSNRSSGITRDDADSDGDGLGDGTEALYEYLGGNAVISERCVLALPDAQVRGTSDAVAAAITPDRILDYLTAAPEDRQRVRGADGTVYAWTDARPRFAADITVPERERYDPWGQLVALGYNGDVNNATIINVPDTAPSLADGDGDGGATGDGSPSVAEDWHFASNGEFHRFSAREMQAWGEERRVGDLAVSPTIIGSVQAQPEGCPSPMPALLHMRRIRHDDQCLYVCGWTIDDGALYDNSLTMLVAKDVNELAHVDYGEPEAMRRAIEAAFTRERSTLGAMVYDGELGRAALPFLPTKLQSGPGFEDLLRTTVETLGERAEEISIPLGGGATRSSDATLQTTIVALDAPVVHLAKNKCQEPPYCANQIPATNTQSSR